MKMKVSILVLILLVPLSVVFLPHLLWKFDDTSPARMGEVEETWQTSNRTFKLQIERRDEESGGILPGAYYVYQSATENSENWRTIFIQRHDDPNPIPTDSARFVGSEIAYVFFGAKYAVTVDGGRQWTIWDAEEAGNKARFEAQGLKQSHKIDLIF